MVRPFDIIFGLGRFLFWRAGFRHSRIPWNNSYLHFWEGGKGDPILLIHGLGSGTFQDFAKLATHLIKKHRVISPDLPGFGFSYQVQMKQSISYQAQFIEQFLDHLEIKQTHVLGNSMGGWVALKFTHRNPQRVRKLILTASAGIEFVPPPLEIFTPNNEADLDRLLSYLCYRTRKIPRWIARDWVRLSRLRRSALIEMLDSMKTKEDLMDLHLKEIKTPTLILWGVQDRLIPSETGQRLKAGLPNARLELIENCGHRLFGEGFPAIAKHLENWLSQSPKEDSTRINAAEKPSPNSSRD